MEKELQTSFIPKKPVVEERAKTRSRPIGFLMLISVLVFIVSVLFAVGVYFYRSYIQDKIASLETSLVRAEDEFEKGLIEELERLERRMKAGADIISSHIVVSPIFAFLEDATLPSVRFSDFSFSKGVDGSSSIEVNLEGEALSYTEIALQSDLLSKNRNLKNVVFSDLALSDRGTVAFSLYFVVDPSFIRFVGSSVSAPTQDDLSLIQDSANQTGVTPNPITLPLEQNTQTEISVTETPETPPQSSSSPVINNNQTNNSSNDTDFSEEEMLLDEMLFDDDDDFFE